MNVALTRARHALYVFGHMKTLKVGKYACVASIARFHYIILKKVFK